MMFARFALIAAVLLADSALAQPPGAESFLVGGSLNLCSSLSPRHCDGQTPDAARSPASYRVDAGGLARVDSDALWQGLPGSLREAVLALLARQAEQSEQAVDARTLSQRLAKLCVDPEDILSALGCEQPGATAPWLLLTDAEQAGVLSALELAQIDASGQRYRERVSLQRSNVAGRDILEAFVASAGQRTKDERPRIGVVTASSLDPFDPVDYYLDALRQAGADPFWLPLDAALAHSVFVQASCKALDSARETHLRLASRELIYPDLTVKQQRFCEEQLKNPGLPENLHGVFFSGGDQWRLRRALVDANEQPNAWMSGLRDAHARGALVIGGTSAGAAIQAGSAMVSNGSNRSALQRGALAGEPPEPGCMASNRCGAAEDDQRLVYWPAGGLGNLPGWVVDTHFSERAREWRLMVLLADSGGRRGIGVDETTAAHISASGEQWHMQVLGAGSVTLIENHGTTACVDRERRRSEGRIHRVPAGFAVSWQQDGPQAEGWHMHRVRSRAEREGDLLEGGVLSDTIARVAAGTSTRGTRLRHSDPPLRLRLARSEQAQAMLASNGLLGYLGMEWMLEHGAGGRCE